MRQTQTMAPPLLSFVLTTILQSRLALTSNYDVRLRKALVRVV